MSINTDEYFSQIQFTDSMLKNVWRRMSVVFKSINWQQERISSNGNVRASMSENKESNFSVKLFLYK